MIRNIPNLFTLLNLFFGCMAIVFILQTNNFSYYSSNDSEYIFSGADSIPEQWWYGSLFIALAAVVDFFDGFVARLLGVSSALGKQLDSLADVVSFGVAPAMIIYQMLRMDFMRNANAMDISIWYLSPAFVLACAGAYRLGKFNLDNSQNKYFTGVPIPAVGLLVASFPLIIQYNTFNLTNILLNKWVLYGIIGLLSWLMVCKYKMMSLKFSKKDLSKQVPVFILAAIAIAGAFLLQWVTVPVVFIAYVVLSLLQQKKMQAESLYPV
jgi:CDP-diacylglycerol--serine O-phosphatidyltransferase